MPASIRKNWSRKGPVNICFRILLGQACPRRAAATGLIKTDAGQYSQKLVGAMAHEKSLSALVGRSMAPEELQQLAPLKQMPAGIRQNWSRKGHMKNRFRILLGGAWPRRAAATCLIKTNAGQYSQKLVKGRPCEKSLSAPAGRSMVSKSCSSRPHQQLMPVSIRKNWPRKGPMKNRCRILLGEAWSRRAAAAGLIQNRCLSVFAKIVRGKGP
jgi:hypothetical protein